MRTDLGLSYPVMVHTMRKLVGVGAASYKASHENNRSICRDSPRGQHFRNAMTLQSMTGFARATGQDDRYSWIWEGRSVNAKGLDVRCRVPNSYEAVEQTTKALAGKSFKRGNITFGLTLDRFDQGKTTYRVNRDLLDQVRGLRTELAGDVSQETPTIEGLLSIRGMLESVDESEDEDALTARIAAMIVSGEEMLEALAVARGAEGALLAVVFDEHLTRLTDLVEAATQSAAAQPEAIRTRLNTMISELIDADARLPEERLAQEAALLAGKADVREELDRLRVHIASAHDLLAEQVGVGRRLDFLCQELNREANTLCSKSADVDLTQIGLDMKATIEQFREQVQNVE